MFKAIPHSSYIERRNAIWLMRKSLDFVASYRTTVDSYRCKLLKLTRRVAPRPHRPGRCRLLGLALKATGRADQWDRIGGSSIVEAR
jgi:hypothetical protein